MIFISGLISIIIQKNTLCANKTRVICFLPELRQFFVPKTFIFLFLGGRMGGAGATAPLPPQLIRLCRRFGFFGKIINMVCEDKIITE